MDNSTKTHIIFSVEKQNNNYKSINSQTSQFIIFTGKYSIITIIIPLQKFWKMKTEQLNPFCCNKWWEVDQQLEQEIQTANYKQKIPIATQTNTFVQNSTNANSQKSVYSFKYHQWRINTKHTPFRNHIHSSPEYSIRRHFQKQNECERKFQSIMTRNVTSKMSNPIVQNAAITVNLNKTKSEQKIFLKINDGSIFPPRTNSPRVTINYSNALKKQANQEINYKRTQVETNYSSQNSQIFTKNNNNTKNNVCLTPPQKLHLDNHEITPLAVPTNHVQFEYKDPSFSMSCKEVSPHEQADQSITNSLLRNARSIKTIITSTQIKPHLLTRQQSKAFTFFPYNQSFGQTVSPICTYQNLLSHNIHYHESNQSLSCQSQTSKQIESPKFIRKQTKLSFPDKIQQSPNSYNHQNLFQNDTIGEKPFSPKISVLDIDQNQASQLQQLRDVIDHNFLQSPNCSKSNSQFQSLRSSMRSFDDEADKKTKKNISFFQQSHENSRQNSSHQHLFFRLTTQKLKRTNTIESFDSISSENSCLDVKFMQRVKERRAVSRLI